MYNQIYFFAIVASTFLTSCAVLRTNPQNTMDIKGVGVIQNPVLVDLEVNQARSTGSATGGIGTSLENIQKAAVDDVLKKADADVLVEPKFESETSDGQTTITVTGFPATYKNFRSMKPEDAQLLQLSVTQKASVYEPPKEPQKKNIGPLLGVLSGFILIVVLLALAN